MDNDAAEAINISPIFIDGDGIESCYVCYGDGCVINLVQVKKDFQKRSYTSGAQMKIKVDQGTKEDLKPEFIWMVKEDTKSSCPYDSRVLDISFVNANRANGDSMTLVFCTEEFVYVYDLTSFIGFNETDHLEICVSTQFSRSPLRVPEKGYL